MIHHLDVVGAYLNSEIPIKQYMYAPPGIAKYKNEAWEVLKSIYGGRGAAADWKGTFVKILFRFGFKAATIDETVFIIREGDLYLILVIFVDDTICIDKWPEMQRSSRPSSARSSRSRMKATSPGS